MLPHRQGEKPAVRALRLSCKTAARLTADHGDTVLRAAAVLAVLLTTALPTTAHAQKLELRNRSRVLLGATQVTDSATLSDKRYSIGFTNTFREGRPHDNTFAGRLDATASTKLQLDAQRTGDETGWELKVNQQVGEFTFDLGTGSNGLFHSGALFGQRKGKGFGFSAAWVEDDRSAGANLQLWHTVEAIDVTFAARHDRRGFGWSADTGQQLANVLRGVLRYETSNGAESNSSSQQVVYGRNLRTGSAAVEDFDPVRVAPEEDVFGDDGVNIRSPLYPQDDPLAWLVEGYGARLGQVELDRKRLLQAEVVSYISDNVWLGGEFVMKDGVADTIDTRFGITGEDLDLAATFGYSPDRERFSGTVQFRWVPFKPVTPSP
jgi:hypothetical protein